MRFESQTHPQDDHIDIITDCSTWYSQAAAVALVWDWLREDEETRHSQYFMLAAEGAHSIQHPYAIQMLVSVLHNGSASD